jgi:predicted Rossmann fold nucleotide-binding protein DprA/Smf involved in DNA uptake
MKLIIAGSRDLFLTDMEISKAVSAFIMANPIPVYTVITPPAPYLTEIVSGKARGIDQLGEAWARARDIPIAPFPADWKKHKKAAGPIRNREMAAYADGALVLWDGKSRGSKNMYETMRGLGKPALCITYGADHD